MKMKMSVSFDAEIVSIPALRAAVAAVEGVGLITFHAAREAAEPKTRAPKIAKAGS